MLAEQGGLEGGEELSPFQTLRLARPLTTIRADECECGRRCRCFQLIAEPRGGRLARHSSFRSAQSRFPLLASSLVLHEARCREALYINPLRGVRTHVQRTATRPKRKQRPGGTNQTHVELRVGVIGQQELSRDIRWKTPFVQFISPVLQFQMQPVPESILT